MPTGHMNGLVNRLRRAALLQDGSDSQLLARFVTQRDGDAFAALVKRHGRMVLGVCRRVLRHEQDAEDAFQATFLVLARKAGSVAAPGALGGWLYRVAYRTALEARARIARRHAKEQQVRDMPEPRVEPEDGWRELLPRLDRELDRLPDKYRVPVVLCELEGRCRKEVAASLHIPEGTLSSRLAHAKKLLARRLARYGAALSVTALSAVLSQDAAASVRPALLNSTAKAVFTAGVVSARVMALTEGVIKAMLLGKLTLVSGLVLAVAVGVGTLGLTYRPAAAQPAPPNVRSRATADELEELRLEVAALRKGLEVTREQVRALREEMRAFNAGRPVPEGAMGAGPKGAAGSMAPGGSSMGGPRGAGGLPATIEYARPKGVLAPANIPPSRMTLGRLQGAVPENTLQRPADPLAQAEAALKKLRANPNDKQAADALERAVKQLKEREKAKAPANTLNR